MTVDSRLHPREPAMVAIAQIRLTARPWHLRVASPALERSILQLALAIQVTGRITPIEILRHDDRAFDLVAGYRRLRAAERLGHVTIPAFILTDAVPYVLLRDALIEQERHVPLSELERGWAIDRLIGLAEQTGRTVTQAHIARELRLDRGSVSGALRSARAVPETCAEQLAAEYGIEPGQIAAMSRRAVRMIRESVERGEADRLLRAACAALQQDADVHAALRDARSAARPTPTAADRRDTKSHSDFSSEANSTRTGGASDGAAADRPSVAELLAEKFRASRWVHGACVRVLAALRRLYHRISTCRRGTS